jgi:hypothetical protein
MSLIDDLIAAEATSPKGQCKACKAIEEAPEDSREALRSALAGSIGRDRLAVICKRNGLDVTRWAISQHRQEGHQA